MHQRLRVRAPSLPPISPSQRAGKALTVPKAPRIWVRFHKTNPFANGPVKSVGFCTPNTTIEEHLRVKWVRFAECILPYAPTPDGDLRRSLSSEFFVVCQRTVLTIQSSTSRVQIRLSFNDILAGDCAKTAGNCTMKESDPQVVPRRLGVLMVNPIGIISLARDFGRRTPRAVARRKAFEPRRGRHPACPATRNPCQL
jgi:hypothetical protein